MLPRQVVLLAALALLTLFAVGWISDHSTRVMAVAVDSVNGTRDVLLAVDHFRAALAEAERSAREYTITGIPSFRADFDRAEGDLRSSLETLKNVAARDPHPPILPSLESLTERRITVLRELIALSETATSSALVNRNVIEGTAISRQLGDVLRFVQSQEVRHLHEQTSATAAARAYALYGPWAMCAIAAVMFAILIAQVSSALRRSSEMSEHLRRAVLREQTARERAQQADQMKDQFLATVSHELRTPLTSILGWCGLIRSADYALPLMKEGIDSIDQAARIQSHLVEDLLDISRIIAGRLSLCISRVDLSEVIDKAVASVQPSARARRITIHKKVSETAVNVAGDPTRLEQIVWNLLSNSIKFSPPGSGIDVSLGAADSCVQLEVTDHGDGIEPDLLPHIFDRFRQGDTSGARKGGLGLGLSIVKNLVEMHGGSVRATSKGRGTGARFTIELPLASGHDGQGTTRVTSPERTLVTNA